MNNPSPLVPQGSMLEQKNKGRARVRLAVFFVLSIHVIGLMALLVQGCRKTEPETPLAETNPAAPSALETTNPPAATMTPPMPETTPSIAAPSVQEYVVAQGDSFYTIAKKFGIPMKAVQDANPNVQPTKLQIGQKLQIPAPASNPGAASAGGEVAGAAAGAGGEQMYTVKSGDTLTKIAAEFGTTVKAIRSENSLTTDKIKVGQKLKIPPKASAPATAPAAPSAPAPAPAATSPTT